MVKRLKHKILKFLCFTNYFNSIKQKQDVDSLYALLYNATQNLENSIDISSIQTKEAFANQWENFKKGKYLLSDPWFRENVDRIICEEEIQIKPEWFKGKNVLDAGCGNGRWSYGFAKLGANVTAVDINQIAIDETRNAIKDFQVIKEFHVSPLEYLSDELNFKKYDLVFCWGVLHHTKSFNKSLKEIIKSVKDDGILYLYLYGRESLDYELDLELFKERIRYNTLPNQKEKYKFLLRKARWNKEIIHNLHDFYAPIINRRFEFEFMKKTLESEGFEDVSRTINHTELFIRSLKGNAKEYYEKWILPKKQPPYWFNHH